MDSDPRELIGKEFQVLDSGFVRVVDTMGTDESVVQAARVSYGEGTKRLREDRSLLRFLMRHKHTSPFEMCEIKLHVRVPMDCWRQWIRHRTANVNEYSTRYSVAIDAAQTTTPDQWRRQNAGNRQGSEGLLDSHLGERLTKREAEIQAACRAAYEERLDAGVAREQARKDLPLSTYTEAYWKIDLHNLLHFLELRMAPNAQNEIRQYADVIGYQIVSRWVPNTWEAFLNYRLNALFLSEVEIRLLSCLYRGEVEAAIDAMRREDWLSDKDGKLTTSREALEFEEKLDRLGIPAPWPSARNGDA